MEISMVIFPSITRLEKRKKKRENMRKILPRACLLQRWALNLTLKPRGMKDNRYLKCRERLSVSQTLRNLLLGIKTAFGQRCLPPRCLWNKYPHYLFLKNRLRTAFLIKKKRYNG